MDEDDTKACIRALLSSTDISYDVNSLLLDFKGFFGCDLPLFGYKSAVEYLRSISDTVKLVGNIHNPEVCLVESNKSSHITALVDKQQSKSRKSKRKRLIIPKINKNNFNLQQNTDTTLKANKRPKEVSASMPPKGDYPPLSFAIENNSKKVILEACSTTVIDKDLGQNLDNDIPEKDFLNYSGEKLQNCSATSNFSLSSSSICSLNECIKSNLKNLIKKFPNGLWCCELPHLYLEEFKYDLEYREFGYTSLIQMLSELPDIFRCVRPGNEDWILFDARLPPTAEEKRMTAMKLSNNVPVEIRTNLHNLLVTWCETTDLKGIDVNLILQQYKKFFGTPLDYLSLGFTDFESFLTSLHGTIFNISEVMGTKIAVPLPKKSFHSPVLKDQALPPITPENDIFYDLFPKDVVGPGENLVELDWKHHLANGRLIEVCAAEVWSPGKFFLQLNKFRDHLNAFMEDLQKFYNVYLNKYKMPEATIVPKQVCVGIYSADPEYPEEWHRAQIVRVINEKMVVVNFLDYGTESRLKKSQLRFLHRGFQSFPVQAFRASLAGIAPIFDKKWPLVASNRFLRLLQVPFLEAEIIDINYEKITASVILYDPNNEDFKSLNRILVVEKLARCTESRVLLSMEKASKTRSKPKEEEPESSTLQMEQSLGVAGISTTGIQSNKEEAGSCALEDIIDWERISVPPCENGHRISGETLLSSSFPPTPLELNRNSYPIERAAAVQTNEQNALQSSVCSSISEASEQNAFSNLSEEIKAIPPISVSIKKTKTPLVKSTTAPDPETSVRPFSSTSTTIEELSQSSTGFNTNTHEDNNSQTTNQVKCNSTAVKSDSESTREFVKTPCSLPPGLEKICGAQDHAFQKPDSVKRSVNALAMEFLQSNPNIREVALFNPQLALKIAIQMAEMLINTEWRPNCTNSLLANDLGVPKQPTSTCRSPVNQCIASDMTQWNEAISNEPFVVPVTNFTVGASENSANAAPNRFIGNFLTFPVTIFNGAVQNPINNSTQYIAAKPMLPPWKNYANPYNRTASADNGGFTNNMEKIGLREVVKAEEVPDLSTLRITKKSTSQTKFVKKEPFVEKTIHIINMNNVLHTCVEELIRLFQLLTDENGVKNILRANKKRRKLEYKIISQKHEGHIISEIEKFGICKNPKGKEIYLLTLDQVPLFMKSLGFTLRKKYDIALQDLKKNFNPKDSYWTTPS